MGVSRWEGAVSGGIRLVADAGGCGLLLGRGYRRSTPYHGSFLSRLASARRGGALVEDILISEEPGRLATRAAFLLGAVRPEARVLHCGAASLAATIAVARLGYARIDAVESNPLWAPLARERIACAGMEERIRLLQEDGPAAGSYDLLLLVCEPPLGPIPAPEEIARAARALRPGGRAVVVSWPAGRPLPAPLSSWRRSGRSDPDLARHRLLHPRGDAPAARRARGVLAALLIPAARWAPGTLLAWMGETNGVLTAPGL